MIFKPNLGTGARVFFGLIGAGLLAAPLFWTTTGGEKIVLIAAGVVTLMQAASGY